ncbi:putative transmembrane reductase CYB561D1 isoform X5 [Callithrix jacchus]
MKWSGSCPVPFCLPALAGAGLSGVLALPPQPPEGAVVHTAALPEASPGWSLSGSRLRLRDRKPGRRARAAGVCGPAGHGHAAPGGRSGSRSSWGAETDPLAAARQWDLGAPGSFGLHHLSDSAVPARNQSFLLAPCIYGLGGCMRGPPFSQASKPDMKLTALSYVHSSASAWPKPSYSSHLNTPRSFSAPEKLGSGSTGQGRP